MCPCICLCVCLCEKRRDSPRTGKRLVDVGCFLPTLDKERVTGWLDEKEVSWKYSSKFKGVKCHKVSTSVEFCHKKSTRSSDAQIVIPFPFEMQKKETVAFICCEGWRPQWEPGKNWIELLSANCKQLTVLNCPLCKVLNYFLHFSELHWVANQEGQKIIRGKVQQSLVTLITTDRPGKKF